MICMSVTGRYAGRVQPDGYDTAAAAETSAASRTTAAGDLLACGNDGVWLDRSAR